MINCITIDGDKKSRETIKKLLQRISGLHVKTCGALEQAVNSFKNNVHVLLIHLHDSVSKEDMALIEKIREHGTQIIVISSRIGAAHDAFTISAADFIMLPTSSTRLCKTIMKALNITDHRLQVPKIKAINSENKEVVA